MEFNDHHNLFLQDILALTRDTSTTNWESLPNFPLEMSDHHLFYNSFDGHDYPLMQLPPSSFQQEFTSNFDFNEVYSSLNDEFLMQQFVDDQLLAPQFTDSSLDTTATPPFRAPAPVSEDFGVVAVDNLEMQDGGCKVEPAQSPDGQVFNVGVCPERKSRGKKLDGQPSKNLMAERRRRKRLNDRLSMLRSIVPKISKMDRTSILGDTIEYMKELLERINKLQNEIEGMGSGQLDMDMVGIIEKSKANDIIVRNSPKFDVERRNKDTRVEISCAAKPGLLLSTITALEALGLEIEQCVVSCFSDFALHASCSEGPELRTLMNSEEIKQALFRSAGYEGRCL